MGSVAKFTAAVPVVLGAIATWGVLKSSDNIWAQSFIAACAFTAGLIPAVMGNIKFNESLDTCKFFATRYKNLGDRFRRAAQITAPNKGLAGLEKEFNALTEEMEKLREDSPITPEWSFNKAKEKIDKGHYNFEVDAAAIEKAEQANQEPPKSTV